MTSRRSPSGWWVSRATNRNPQAQPVQYNFDLYGPQPLRLLPKPVVATKETTEKKSRMGKFTSVEKKFLELGRFLLSERAGEYGYAMKLVKRGYITALASKTKHITVFTITPAGERARAGMSLLKAVQGKQGIASSATFGHAVAAAG